MFAYMLGAPFSLRKIGLMNGTKFGLHISTRTVSMGVHLWYGQVPTTATVAHSPDLPMNAWKPVDILSGTKCAARFKRYTLTHTQISHLHSPFSQQKNSPAVAAELTSLEVSLLTAWLTLTSINATRTTGSRLPSQQPEAATSSGVRVVWFVVLVVIVPGAYYVSSLRVHVVNADAYARLHLVILRTLWIEYILLASLYHDCVHQIGFLWRSMLHRRMLHHGE